MYVTGNPASLLHGVDSLVGSLVTNNGVGIQVNGLHQVDTSFPSNSSIVAVQVDLIENNTIGLLAENDSQVGMKSDTVGYNALRDSHQKLSRAGRRKRDFPQQQHRPKHYREFTGTGRLRALCKYFCNHLQRVHRPPTIFP